MPEQARVAIPVWDPPVRIVHWLIVLLFALQVVTGKIGGDLMRLHAWSGYTVLALVIFRVLWGFGGSVHARFADFACGPATAVRFATRLFSRHPSFYAGHNPLGGWSVIAMTALLSLQAIAGFFSNDGDAFEGPLAHLVSIDVSNRLAHLHRWNGNLLLVIAGLHVAAVLFHWLGKKEDLIRAMFTGVKHVPPDVAAAAPRDRAWSPRRAAGLLALAIAVVAVVIAAGPR